MDNHTDALLVRTRERCHRLIDMGEAQRDELAAVKAEAEELRHQRDMLARRLAELAHKHYGVSYRQVA